MLHDQHGFLAKPIAYMALYAQLICGASASSKETAVSSAASRHLQNNTKFRPRKWCGGLPTLAGARAALNKSQTICMHPACLSTQALAQPRLEQRRSTALRELPILSRPA